MFESLSSRERNNGVCYFSFIFHVLELTTHIVSEYKYGARIGFTPSQRWRSTASDPFPYCKLQRAETDMIRSEWMNMGNSQGIMDKFMNLHCLETNVMEGTLQFNESVGSFLFLL